MAVVTKISARKILASLGDETVEARVELADARSASASVPAGISAGKSEVKKVPADEAIREIGEMGKSCEGKDWTQEGLDREISARDYGGNATLAVSAALWKALNLETPPAGKFPKLMVLMFEGGKHGNANITIQEFLVVEDSLEEARRDFFRVRKYLEEQNAETTVGAEGGFSPLSYTNEQALETIKKVLPGKSIALDVAGTFKQGQALDYGLLLSKFPIVSLEDPYGDEDWEKWAEFTKTHGQKILVVGDDLVTTNRERIEKASLLSAVNAVIIKPNQIGTITATLEAVTTARKAGLKIIVSHRGEETDDDWIADLAVAVKADYVKFGGMDRGERIAKYNRLAQLGMK